MGKLLLPHTTAPPLLILAVQNKNVLLSGHINGESEAVQWVRVRTDRGSVTLKTQSWFETLKLGGQE